VFTTMRLLHTPWYVGRTPPTKSKCNSIPHKGLVAAILYLKLARTAARKNSLHSEKLLRVIKRPLASPYLREREQGNTVEAVF
jgi:hypothetical protein